MRQIGITMLLSCGIVIVSLSKKMVMAENNKKNGFKTDAFTGALKKNEEMNKEDKASTSESSSEDKKSIFPINTFNEALKINEEMNEKGISGVRASVAAESAENK